MSNRANLANGLTASALDATTNTLRLQPGYAVNMPPVPFYLTITPFGQLPAMGNSEIVQVTAVSGDSLNIVRAQKGTVRKAFPVNSVVSNSVYADDKIGADNIDFTTTVGIKAHDTNVTPGTVVVQCGWTQFIGNSTVNNKQFITPVSFPKQFKKIHSITCTFVGYKVGSQASGLQEFTNAVSAGNIVEANAISNTGFNVVASSAGGMGAAWHGVSWVAIGEV